MPLFLLSPNGLFLRPNWGFRLSNPTLMQVGLDTLGVMGKFALTVHLVSASMPLLYYLYFYDFRKLN